MDLSKENEEYKINAGARSGSIVKPNGVKPDEVGLDAIAHSRSYQRHRQRGVVADLRCPVASMCVCVCASRR